MRVVDEAWGLRDYGVQDQIGLEQTLEEYHANLLKVTAECKRVLKKTGTMFWVHGDSYGGSGQGAQTGYADYKRKGVNGTMEKAVSLSATPKCLTMQNYRLAMRMIDEQGWILRNILIWHKKNHMPSSVKDRYANAYEPVFFFSKNKSYHFDLDAVRVPHTSLNNPPGNLQKERFEGDQYKRPRKSESFNIAGKNPGDVFTLPTQPFPEAHFAVYPEKLIEPFIKAGCPSEVCKYCGFTRERVIETKSFERFELSKEDPRYRPQRYDKKYETNSPQRYSTNTTIGWTDCECKDKNKYEPGIVLDPFMGAGTTAVVAKKQGKSYIGIELNQEYIEIARKRIAAIPMNLDNWEEK